MYFTPFNKFRNQIFIEFCRLKNLFEDDKITIEDFDIIFTETSENTINYMMDNFEWNNVIKIPANKNEAIALLHLINKGYLDLFGVTDAAQKQLIANIDAIVGDYSNTNYDDLIVFKGKSNNADEFDEIIINNIAIIEEAINKNKAIEYLNCFNDSETWESMVPVKFIYSRLDGKFRIFGYDKEGNNIRVYLCYIRDIRLIDKKEFAKQNDIMYYVDLEIKDEKNAVEILLSRMGDCTRVQKKIDNIFQIRFYYDPIDESRIISRFYTLIYRIEFKKYNKNFVDKLEVPQNSINRTDYIKEQIKKKIEIALCNYGK